MEQVREQNNELRRRTQVMVFPLAAPLISFAVLPVACNPYGAGGGADYWRAASRQRSAADPSTSILTTRDSSIVSALDHRLLRCENRHRCWPLSSSRCSMSRQRLLLRGLLPSAALFYLNYIALPSYVYSFPPQPDLFPAYPRPPPSAPSILPPPFPSGEQNVRLSLPAGDGWGGGSGRGAREDAEQGRRRRA